MSTLLPHVPTALKAKALAGFEWNRDEVREVAADHDITDGRTLLLEAVHFDAGDKILSGTDLRRAALSIASPTHAQLGRGFNGQYKGRLFNAKELDAALRHFGVADVTGVLERAIVGIPKGGTIDFETLRNASSALAAPFTRDLEFSSRRVEATVAKQALPGRSALLGAARLVDDGDRILSPLELKQAAKFTQALVPPNDVAEVLKRIGQLEGRDDVKVTTIGQAKNFPIHALHFPSTSGAPRLKVLVTGGVHGNEPAGTGAAMLLVERWLQDPELRNHIDLTVIPLVNPRSMHNGTRRTPAGVDLNRRFNRPAGAYPEVDAVRGVLTSGGFDLVMDLHSGGAKRDGFWLLHHGAKEILPPALRSFGERWPRLVRNVAPYTMKTPGLGESSNAATLKGLAASLGVPWAMTLEAPASVSYHDGVLGEFDLLESIMASALETKTPKAA